MKPRTAAVTTSSLALLAAAAFAAAVAVPLELTSIAWGLGIALLVVAFGIALVHYARSREETRDDHRGTR